MSLETVLAERGGVFGSSDESVATLAYEYVALVESGNRSPSKSLAARFGGSAGTWTNRVALARKRGFLSAVARGEAGGALTEQGRVALGLDQA